MSMCGSCPIYSNSEEVKKYFNHCEGNASSESCVYTLIEYAEDIKDSLSEDNTYSLQQQLKIYPELKEFEELAPFGKVGRKAVSEAVYNQLLECLKWPAIKTDIFYFQVKFKNGILVFASRATHGVNFGRLNETIILRRESI